VADKRQLPDALERVVAKGDIVISLGAGDVNACVRDLATRLSKREASS
jgi:UDP-N-acetylmuramate--alanine ligase